MPYLSELHYCCNCKVYLGPDNGDGICSECESMICDSCGEKTEIADERCNRCKSQED